MIRTNYRKKKKTFLCFFETILPGVGLSGYGVDGADDEEEKDDDDDDCLRRLPGPCVLISKT